MRALFLILGVVFVLTAQFMVLKSSPENVFLEAQNMVVKNPTNGFESVKKGTIQLLKDPQSAEVVGMKVILTFETINNLFSKRIIDLVINDISVDNCGTTNYYAGLEDYSSENGFHRFNVYLQDHSHRICTDVVEARWVARVNEGYGFCGTMDDHMTLLGEPSISHDSIEVEGDVHRVFAIGSETTGLAIYSDQGMFELVGDADRIRSYIGSRVVVKGQLVYLSGVETTNRPAIVISSIRQVIDGLSDVQVKKYGF